MTRYALKSLRSRSLLRFTSSSSTSSEPPASGSGSGLRFDVAPEEDRRVRLEGPTAGPNPHHLAGPELVVERSLVPGCAGVELPDLAGELGVRRERAGGHLEVLAAHGAALLFPHQAPEPRVAAARQRHGLAVYQGVRSAVLVHEKLLHVLKGVAYEPVGLVAALLLLLLVLRLGLPLPAPPLAQEPHDARGVLLQRGAARRRARRLPGSLRYPRRCPRGLGAPSVLSGCRPRARRP